MPTQEEILKIIPVISQERFESYRKHGNTDDQALARVNWNIALSEAIYPCIQALEVGFRNRLHQSIATVCGDPNWILNPIFLKQTEVEMVDSAKEDLVDRNRPVTAGYLIADLKFGFWTSLADARYDKMWHKIIKSVFPAMPNAIRTRGEISARLQPVRHLRNSIFHHHSIWHWGDLERQYNDIYTLIGWIEPAYALWIKQHDRFPAVFAGGYEAYLPAA